MEEQTVNHFAEKEGELAQAMETLSKYRKKYGSFENQEDLAARHRNVLHDAPLIERLVPGLGLQLFLGDAIMADVNPHLGYRFTERLTIGASWNERVAFGSSVLNDSRVYGPLFMRSTPCGEA